MFANGQFVLVTDNFFKQDVPVHTFKLFRAEMSV